ncbi:MAG: hypothetical protein LBQ19_06170 [Synergistaceae bacterium]|jgi:hypothetical protein|nr:hypothetical protein [Synergistaceae bacterium]
MKKAAAFFFIFAMALLAHTDGASAVPRSIVIKTGDREAIKSRITSSMQEQRYKLVSADQYQLVFEKPLQSFFENVTNLDPLYFRGPKLRKIWSVLPSQHGIEATVDILIASSPGTAGEKVIATEEVVSFNYADHEKINKEKLYDLFGLMADIEGLDRYFVMRASGLFPELKPETPKADMLLEGDRIIAVLPDGVAGKAGVKAGDIILEINGNPAEGDIINFIDTRLARGNRVVLTLQRGAYLGIITLMNTD